MAADVLAVKGDDSVSAATKDTGRLILFKHDAAFINEDLKRIFFIDVERPAKFDGQNNTAKFIDLADNSSRFQYDCLPKISCCCISHVYSLPYYPFFVKDIFRQARVFFSEYLPIGRNRLSTRLGGGATGYFLAIVTAASLIYGACSGNLPAVSAAALGECSHAATLSLELLGTLCLWSGISAVAEECGLTAWTAKLLAPVLKLLFPAARRDERVMKAISMNMTANLLGLGNAATPLGIKAMRELKRAGGNLSAATKDMALFVVINTASLQILPTTIAALRLEEGSPAPMDILPAVWMTGGFSLLAGILAAQVFCREAGS